MMHRKRSRLVHAAFILIATLCFISPVQASSAQGFTEAAIRVVAVHDGDTVSVMRGKKTEKVRLLGIDAPEMGQRPWGPKAKRHLQELLKRSGWMVSIEFDIDKRDKYGRLLAYLWTKDRTLLNLEMVEDGFAVLFTLPPNVKHADTLRTGQHLARERGLRIWGKDGLKEMPLDYKKAHPR
jgi:micrococcal nuclease